MTLQELIQQQVDQLPPEKQTEVLDFVEFLRQQLAHSKPAQAPALRQHPAFGAWRAKLMHSNSNALCARNGTPDHDRRL